MADAPSTELSRDLGLFTITMVGVGAMIGAGIFVLTGIAAGTAGPALILAFAGNGLVTLLTALAYAELGSAIPEAGGGYLWVKEGLPGPNAFMAGWMSWFAHAVAGSLYALGFAAYLGYTFGEFGVHHVAGLPVEGAVFEKGLAVVIALIFIAINFKGVSETGLAGNIVTVAKVLIIGLFIGSGLWAIFSEPSSVEKFRPFVPEGLGGVLSAMGLTYIAFEGYEIIVQAGEEVKNPKRNIPRAVFWSLVIVIPIYILVAVAAIGGLTVTPELAQQAGMSGDPATWQILGQLGETGLADAATQFMPLGTTLLLIGGILSTMSALNATTFSSTRVSFAMGRDKNLPDFFAQINEATKTPYLALAASGALIITMAVGVPEIHDVAAAADVMFLLLFLQVNIAIITIRRKYGDKLDYGFLIPFFPYTPIVAIVLMLGLAVYMFSFSPLAWFVVIGWLGSGFLIYYTYARKREREKRATPVVMQEAVHGEKKGYRVLVPVANPESAAMLIRLGAKVARARDGEVVLLHVITVPKQSPYAVAQRYVKRAREEVLDAAIEAAHGYDVPVRSAIRVARKPASAVVDQIKEHDVNLVVMGWRGRSRHPRTTIGSNIDVVLRDADCDVAVLRADDLDEIRQILVPIAYPNQARLMMEIGDVFARQDGSELKLFHALSPSTTEKERERQIERLRSGLLLGGEDDEGGGETADGEAAASRRIIDVEETDDVVGRIAARSKEHDLTIIGASREGWARKLVAGTVPERLARATSGRLLLVKHGRGALHSSLLETVEFFRETEPEDTEEAKRPSAAQEESKSG